MTDLYGTYSDASGFTRILTVPTGVTAGMQVLIALGTADSTAVTCTPSTSGSGSFTLINSGAAGNMYNLVWKGSGCVAGDTITLTLSLSKAAGVEHFYTDDVTAFGTVAPAIRPGSQSTITTGSVTPAAGQRVYGIFIDRTSTTPTVSSVTSSGGETVTQVGFHHTAPTSVVGCQISRFDASANAARTMTETLSGPSGNGRGIAILATAAGPTNWSDSPVNSRGAVDSMAIERGVVITDDRGATDAGQSIGHTGSQTDWSGSTDEATPTLTGGASLVVTITDDRGATDSGQSIGRVGSQTEARGATDTATPSLVGPTGYTQSPVDNAGRTDSITIERGVEIVLTDDRGATEDPTDPGYDEQWSLTEDAGRTDSVIVIHPVAVDDIVDDRVARDSLAIERSVNAADDGGHTDSVTFEIANVQDVSDSRGATDTVTWELTPSPGTIVVTPFPELRGATDSIQVFLSSTLTVYLTDSRGATDEATFDRLSRLMRLVPTSNLLFDNDGRYPRRTRRGPWTGVMQRVAPILTEKAILLWQDGRYQIVEEVPLYSDASLDAPDAIIAGGYEWRGYESEWEARVLTDAGFLLEPVT